MKAVILDLYGTLIHIPHTRVPVLRLFTEMGLSPTQIQAAFIEILTAPYPTTRDFLQKHFPNAQIDPAPYEAEDAIELATAQLFEESIEVLEALKAKNLRLTLLSNCNLPYKLVFQRFHLEKYFDHIFLSCDVGYAKPQPQMYQLMLETIQIAPEDTLMVGDVEKDDVLMPRSFGMHAYLLDRTNNSTSEQTLSSLRGLLDLV